MQPKHEMLRSPLNVSHDNGRLDIFPEKREKHGAGVSINSLHNSIDTDLVAIGPSAKGDNRATISRHGKYVLWSFEGPVSEMTEAGKRLFVNTVFYTFRHKDAPVLERKMNNTRDRSNRWRTAKLQARLKRVRDFSLVRPYIRSGKQVPKYRPCVKEWELDEFAEKLGIANYKKSFLKRCIDNLKDKQDVQDSLKALVRYTGKEDVRPTYEAWNKWFTENRDYLYFSDCEDFHFLIDKEAKEKGLPTAVLRNWSSENLDYRCDDLKKLSWRPKKGNEKK